MPSGPLPLIFIAAALAFAGTVFASIGSTLYGIISAIDGVLPFPH
ncbi:hypothetical protein [Streptacidiphilus sp. MAP5-3]|jgi:hypothetical protein